MSNRLWDPEDPDPVVGSVPGPEPLRERLVHLSQVSPDLAAELALERYGDVPDAPHQMPPATRTENP